MKFNPLTSRASATTLLVMAFALSNTHAAPLFGSKSVAESLASYISPLRFLVPDSPEYDQFPLANDRDADEDDNYEYVSPLLSAPDHETCPIDTPISCSAPGEEDSCCYEGSNGMFLATQFWDYNPATGPSDLFTTHGLWSNMCGGGYKQFCNPSWAIHNATAVLEQMDELDLLKEMQYTWKDISGRDADLWEHEFNKHATCMYTLNPSCYKKSSSQYQYVVDFFKTVVSLESTLGTYKFLEEAGIVPSEDKPYSKQDILDAIHTHTNHTVRLGCTRSGALQEVWYYFHLRGSVVSGSFIPMDTPDKDSCSDSVWYYPKGSKKNPIPGYPRPGKPGKPGVPATKGHIRLENQPGCLISNGHWYTSGTCATFRKREATFGGITITSSKGNCDVVDGVFNCARGNSLGQFTEDGDGNIVYGGQSTWSAEKQPTGPNQQPVSIGDKGELTFKMKVVNK